MPESASIFDPGSGLQLESISSDNSGSKSFDSSDADDGAAPHPSSFSPSSPPSSRTTPSSLRLASRCWALYLAFNDASHRVESLTPDRVLAIQVSDSDDVELHRLLNRASQARRSATPSSRTHGTRPSFATRSRWWSGESHWLGVTNRRCTGSDNIIRRIALQECIFTRHLVRHHAFALLARDLPQLCRVIQQLLHEIFALIIPEQRVRQRYIASGFAHPPNGMNIPDINYDTLPTEICQITHRITTSLSIES